MANGNWRVQIIWDDITGAIADFNGTYPIKITLAEVETETEIDDEIALKSENEELKAKITELEAQLVALQPKYPWSDYYKGFDERVEYLSFTTPINNKIYFRYNNEQKLLTINAIPTDFDQKYQYLFIITSDGSNIIYIRYVPPEAKGLINEIYGEHKVINWQGQTFIPNMTLEFDVNDSGLYRYFRYIFRKPLSAV